MHNEALASLAATLALSPKVEEKVLDYNQNLCHPEHDLKINEDAKQGTKIKIVCNASSNIEPKNW